MSISGGLSLFDSLTFNSKVYLSLGLTALVAFLFFVYGITGLNKINTTKHELISNKFAVIDDLNSLNASLNHSTLILSNILAEKNNSNYITRWELTWNFDIHSVKNRIRTSEVFKTEGKLQDLQRKLLITLKNIEARQRNLVENPELTDTSFLISKLTHTVNPLITEFNDNSILLKSMIRDEASKNLSQLNDQLKKQELSNYIFLFLIILCLLLSTWILITSYLRSKREIKEALAIFNNGDLLSSGKSRFKENEDMDLSMSQLSKQLENVRDFASKVGDGSLDNDISVFNNKGEVGRALLEMRNSLNKVATEDNQRNWLNAGYAKFGDILRENNDNMTELCDSVIVNLVKYLGANQGALFLKIDNDEGHEVLKMRSCYAFERLKREDLYVYRGEGLLGRAWQERDMIFLTEIPDNYVNIKSGLGNSNPTCLIIVPLIANEIVIGALEIASFKIFMDYEKEFIEEVSNNIAAAIGNTQGNEQTKRLLETSQQMTEELRAQEEEMRQNMEELEATQEEMKRTQLEIERSESNMSALVNNTTDIIFAIDSDYIVTVSNDAVKEFYQTNDVALDVGSNMLHILSGEAKEFWVPRYNRVLKGEKFVEVNKLKSSNGSLMYMEVSYNPIINTEGRTIGASILSKDVTVIKLAEEEIMAKQAMLSSILDNTSDTFFAIDTNYKITVVNKTLKDRFAPSKITLNEGENIFDKLPKDTYDFWKEKYDRALSGENFSFIQDRPVKDDVLTIEVFCNPVVNENGDLIGASVMSRDITKRVKAEKKLDEIYKKQKEKPIT